MRRLTDSAQRAKRILEQAGAPLNEECMQVLRRDLTRTLGNYFELAAEAEVKIERGGNLVITVRAEAVRARPFGVLRG